MKSHLYLFKKSDAIRKKLSKYKVGLPKKVVFTYDKGIVTCYPKEKKWVVILVNKKKATHYVSGRNDVTKYKARKYLKLFLSGIWKPDKGSV